jgi:hypothetical protein
LNQKGLHKNIDSNLPNSKWISNIEEKNHLNLWNQKKQR